MRSLLFAALLLAGCGERPVDVEAIAHDTAVDATAGKFSDLESRIVELESQISDLESTDSSTDSSLREIAAEQEVDKRNIETLFANDRKLDARFQR